MHTCSSILKFHTHMYTLYMYKYHTCTMYMSYAIFAPSYSELARNGPHHPLEEGIMCTCTVICCCMQVCVSVHMKNYVHTAPQSIGAI